MYRRARVFTLSVMPIIPLLQVFLNPSPIGISVIEKGLEVVF
jgi:hypothetical protein